MSKLYRARSLLYRRQILQVHIRWKALDEIYKICMLLHRPDLNISATFYHCLAFSTIEMLKRLHYEISSRISLISMKFARIFSDILDNAEKRCNNFSNFVNFLDFNLISRDIPKIYVILIKFRFNYSSNRPPSKVLTHHRSVGAVEGTQPHDLWMQHFPPQKERYG